MTKHASPSRELFGILGRIEAHREVQKKWNRYFVDSGMDASMDYYPTTVETLAERLSEMYHFDRRMYLVADELQESIAPLLDVCDSGPVFAVWNDGGVLVPLDSEESLRKKLHTHGIDLSS